MISKDDMGAFISLKRKPWGKSIKPIKPSLQTWFRSGSAIGAPSDGPGPHLLRKTIATKIDVFLQNFRRCSSGTYLVTNI